MIYAIVALLVLIADQAVKFWTTKNIVLNAVGDQCVSLIDGVVHMTNVHNHGAAFGILQDARWPLAIVSALFVIVIIVLINKEIIHTRSGKWLAVLVVAGALGNCIDRVLYGYVVDMFEVEFMNFAVFNVADIFITVCGILFCIHVIFHNEPEAVKAANEPEFIRRRREKAEAAAAPYAAIPKRGEHKTLEEELAAADPDDPFAEWVFGDVVEDTPYTIEDIRTRFGELVASLVDMESENKRPGQPKSETWRIRKEESLAHDKDAPIEAKYIMLADKLSNMRATLRDFEKDGNSIWQKFNMKDVAQQEWYYRTVAEVLRDLEGEPLYREYQEILEKIFV